MKNIWISGSINSGKTTVSKILSKELKMAVVELDSFSTFVEQFLGFKDYVSLNYDMVAEIVQMYNKRGYGVIVAYPIMEKKNAFLQETCPDFLFVTLDPGLGVSLTDRGDRKLNDWERERILQHYENSVHDLSFGTRIDTKNLSPEETAQKIIACLENVI